MTRRKKGVERALFHGRLSQSANSTFLRKIQIYRYVYAVAREHGRQNARASERTNANDSGDMSVACWFNLAEWAVVQHGVYVTWHTSVLTLFIYA